MANGMPKAFRVLSCIALASAANALADTWVVNETRSKMDDVGVLTIFLPATQEARNRYGGSYIPGIGLRCQGRNADLIFLAGTMLDGRYSISLRMRFDNGEPERTSASMASSNQGGFIRPAEQMFRRIIASKRLLIEYEPYRAAPTVAEFSIPDIRPHAEAISRNCGFTPLAPAPASTD